MTVALSLDTLVEDLLQSDAVTFYEALVVVHCARGLTLEETSCERLLGLYDAPQTTDGARGVLRPFLARHAKQRYAEDALARQTILRKHSGRTVRGAAGAMLLVRLEERRASGYLWKIQHLEGPLHARRRLDRADLPFAAEFDLYLEAAGAAKLILAEERDQGLANLTPRIFELRVLISPQS